MGARRSETPRQEVTRGLADRPSPLPLEAGVGFRLSRLVRNLRKDWAEELIEVGVTPPQAAILRAVGLWPESSVRFIARAIDSDPMNVKRCVDELEAKGLIESGVREGRRASRRLSLSVSGANLVAEIDTLARAQQRRIEDGLGAELHSHLLRSLDRLETLLSNASDDDTTIADGEV